MQFDTLCINVNVVKGIEPLKISYLLKYYCFTRNGKMYRLRFTEVVAVLSIQVQSVTVYSKFPIIWHP